MNEERINRAIASRRLPLDIGDYIILGLNSSISIFVIIGILTRSINSDPANFLGLLGGGIFMILILTYVSWKIIYQKSLITYQSSLPGYNKRNVIEKLAALNEWRSAESGDNHCIFYINKTKITDKYTVIIIYCESGYGVNTTSGWAQSRMLASDKSRHIIERIKELEVQL